MNELENSAASMNAESENVSLSCREAENNECVETSSPALDLAEAADKAEDREEDVCVEKESPALDLAEAADKAEECKEEECAVTESPALDLAEVADEEEEIRGMRRFHQMSKEELLAELKAIVDENRLDSHREVASLKQCFFNIKSNEALEELNNHIEAGNSPSTFTATADESEAEFKRLYTLFKERRLAYIEEQDIKREENLKAKREILANMKEIAEDIDNINLKFPDFQRLQQEFKEIKEVPATSETEIWKEFQNVTEQFYDHLKMNKELRDLDFKKNYEAKTALIEAARALEEEPDTIQAFKEVQSLQNQWRELGPVAKEFRDSIWDDFRSACTVIYKRHQDYFLKRKEEETANETAKIAICEKIEEKAANTSELTSFVAWDAATKEIIDLQKQWKELGYASRKVNNKLFERYRKACDDFFEKKTAYFKQTREEFNENLEKKTRLCERVEELLRTGLDNRKAADEVMRLQTEWKTIGSVPKKFSDKIWQRFTTACNSYFEQRKEVVGKRRQEENANLKVKTALLTRLEELKGNNDRAAVEAALKDIQAEWKAAGHVPFKQRDEVNEKYLEIVREIYSSLRSGRDSRRPSMNVDMSEPAQARRTLTRILTAKKAELQTVENNIGFFNVKSKSGNSMLKDMERKIKTLKKEIEEAEAKLAELDR